MKYNRNRHQKEAVSQEVYFLLPDVYLFRDRNIHLCFEVIADLMGTIDTINHNICNM